MSLRRRRTREAGLKHAPILRVYVIVEIKVEGHAFFKQGRLRRTERTGSKHLEIVQIQSVVTVEIGRSAQRDAGRIDRARNSRIGGRPSLKKCYRLPPK